MRWQSISLQPTSASSPCRRPGGGWAARTSAKQTDAGTGIGLNVPLGFVDLS